MEFCLFIHTTDNKFIELYITNKINNVRRFKRFILPLKRSLVSTHR